MTLSAATIRIEHADQITLSNDRAQVEVFKSGGGIHNYTFQRADGQIFQPLAEASWLDEYRNSILPDIPRHLQLIGGEFPCVPFGTTKVDEAHHGFCADNIWEIEERGSSYAVLSIDYPDDHVVKRLRRTIEIEETTGALKFSLEVFVRKNCRLPIGVHPIFRMPAETAGMRIVPPIFERGSSAPDTLFQGVDSVLVPSSDIDRKSRIWNSINTLNNELVQLWNTNGDIRLEYPFDQCAVNFIWDNQDLPHCLFWVANPALQSFPIGDGFVGIGIEPTNSFFDANDLAANHAELHRLEADCFGVEIEADGFWSTNYEIRCTDIPSNTGRNIE